MRRLFIECGAAETRAALFDKSHAVKFWFGRARGDENLPRSVEDGDICLGRITAIAKPLNGAFVGIGAPEDAFLSLAKGEVPPVEGASLIVRVRRPALPGKGALVETDWRRELSATIQNEIEANAAGELTPRVLSPPIDAAVAIARKAAAFAPNEIVVDRPDAANALSRNGYDARTDENSVAAAKIADEIEDALRREVALPGGARMIVDETEALTAVDIDMGAVADNSRGALNESVNRRAAERLFRELSRRAIGGRIIVDFLPPASPAERGRLTKLLIDIDRDLYRRRAGRLAPDGLYDLTAARREPSLLERATALAGEGWPRPGRKLTLDWQAKAAVSSLEGRLRLSRSAFLTLLVSPDISTYLEGRERWLARLRDRFGARFAVGDNLKPDERSFDIAETSIP